MKILTAKVLRETLGDYPTIQHLTEGKPDDYEFEYNDNLIDRSNYIACKLWHKIDVASVLQELGYKGTEEEVNKVLEKARGKIEELEDATETDWMIIESACEDAGFKRKC